MCPAIGAERYEFAQRLRNTLHAYAGATKTKHTFFGFLTGIYISRRINEKANDGGENFPQEQYHTRSKIWENEGRGNGQRAAHREIKQQQREDARVRTS